MYKYIYVYIYINSDYTINYEQVNDHGEMKCISSIIVKKL